MKSVFKMLVTVLLVCFSTPAQARSLTPVEGLEALRRAFAGLNDFSAEITQEKKLSIMKNRLVMHGQVRFKKPDRFMMEMSPPYVSKVLLKDALLEQRVGVNGELQKLSLPPEQGLSRWLSNIAKPVTAVPAGMVVKADLNNGVYLVSIAPAGSGQMREITIQFQEDGTIRKLVLEERNGDKTVMSFRKNRRNTGLTDADFRLE
jgi:outer membrane lipoprotein carrier protein